MTQLTSSATCDDFNRPDQDGLGWGGLGPWQQMIKNPPEPPGKASIVSGEARILSDGVSTFGFGISRYIDLGSIEPPFEVFLEHRVWIPGDWAAQGSGFDGPSQLNVQFGFGSVPAFDDFATPPQNFYQGDLSNFQITNDPPNRSLRAGGTVRRSEPTAWAFGEYVFEEDYVDGTELFTRVRATSPDTLYIKSWYVGQTEPDVFTEIPVANPPSVPMRFLILENESRGWNYTMPETIPNPEPEWRIDRICVDEAPPPVLVSKPVPPPTERNDQPNEEEAGDPVSTYSGALEETDRDVTISGRGPAIDFVRAYHSNDPRVGPLGPGWTHNYATNLHLADDESGDMYLIGPTGRSDRYVKRLDGTFTPPTSIHTELVANPDGSFTASHKDGSSWTFDSGGRLTAVIDRYGNTSALTYGAGGRLTGIGDPGGRGSLTLAYTNGLLTSVTDWASPARTVTYEYDTNGRLWKVTDREGKTTTYGYDGASERIATITDARGNVALTTTYDAQGRVATQKDARGLITGDVTTFDYVVNPDGTRVTTLTLPSTSFEPSFQPTLVDTYDANGWLTQRQTAPSSTETLTASLTYDAAGNRTSATDPRGNTTDYCYDVDYAGAAIPGDAANLTRVIAPAPEAGAARPTSLMTYATKHNVIQTLSPKGVPSGQTVTCATDLSAINTAFAADYTYDASGVTLLSTTERLTDPDAGLQAAVTKYEYGDPLNPGLVTRVIPPRGNTGPSPDYTYSSILTYYTTGTRAGQLKDVTDPLGNKTSYDYDPLGRLISVVDPLGNAAGGVPAEHTTTYSYDKEDRLRFATLPAPAVGQPGLVSETRYNEVGKPIVRIDANGQVVTYDYDVRNSLFQVKESPTVWTDPASPPAGVITTEYSYDSGGNTIRVTRAKGDGTYERVTDYVYDGRGLGRREALYPAWPNTTGSLVATNAYDPAGNLQTSTDPLDQTITFGYDALNRLTSIDYSDPDTPDVAYGYDAHGNRTSMTDGTGATSYVYDEANRPTSATSPGPNTVGYRYDLDGNRTKLIYPDATAVTYSFDKASQLASLLDWASRSVSYAYTPDGLVSTATNPNASLTTYAYDNARRLIDIVHTKSGGQPINRFLYGLDSVGNVTSVANGSFALQFARPDGLASSNGTWTGTFASINEVVPNDTTFIASPTSPTTSHFYEVTLTNVAPPFVTTGTIFRYRYAKSGNNSGKTINLTVELRQGTTVIASQTHNNIPGVTGSGWQQGNVTLTPAQAALVTNVADLRLRFRPSSTGGGQGRQAQISWAEAQLPASGDPATQFTYGYDRLYRLTAVTGPDGPRSYTYDPTGNRLTKVAGITTAYTYDRADRILSTGPTSISVDANGNLTTKGSDTFGFDQANRMTVAMVSGASESYSYDGDGTRFSRQVGASPGTRYVSDVAAGLPTTIDDGARKYVYGVGLAYAIAGASVEVYHADRLGSVRVLTDSVGTITATYRTDEWGLPATSSGSSTQPLGFTGEPLDATGMTYLRARYYDADLGRMTSRDTWTGSTAASQTQNRFAYANGNPTTFADPSGRCIVDSAADIAFIAFDVLQIVFGPEKERQSNVEFLGLDAAGLVVPCVAGAGFLRRVIGSSDAIRYLDDGDLIIGKFDDVGALSACRSGDHCLNLPWLPEGPGRWEQNRDRLQQAIDRGERIRDISPEGRGGFLDLERALLRQNGLVPDPSGSGYWIRP